MLVPALMTYSRFLDGSCGSCGWYIGRLPWYKPNVGANHSSHCVAALQLVLCSVRITDACGMCDVVRDVVMHNWTAVKQMCSVS
jgi:hypothetical protein